MWPSLGQEQDSKCSKTVEVWCGCQELKPCQSEITADEIQEKKKHAECRNIEARAAVHLLAQCHAKQPMGSREFQAFSTLQESDPYCATHYDLP